MTVIRFLREHLLRESVPPKIGQIKSQFVIRISKLTITRLDHRRLVACRKEFLFFNKTMEKQLRRSSPSHSSFSWVLLSSQNLIFADLFKTQLRSFCLIIYWGLACWTIGLLKIVISKWISCEWFAGHCLFAIPEECSVRIQLSYESPSRSSLVASGKL